MKTIKSLYLEQEKLQNQSVKLSAWVRTNRAQKEFGFLTINDGTTDRKSVV